MDFLWTACLSKNLSHRFVVGDFGEEERVLAPRLLESWRKLQASLLVHFPFIFLWAACLSKKFPTNLSLSLSQGQKRFLLLQTVPVWSWTR